MLKLILGPAGCGKTSYITEEIKKRAEAGHRGMVLLVPDQYSHEAERELCRKGGDRISLCAEVLSFNRLATRVFSITGGAAKGFLDNGGRVLVMSRALKSCAGNLRVYNSFAGKAEYLTNLISAMDELRAGGITGGELVERAEEAPGALREKLLDMALIIENYDAISENIALDPMKKLELLAEKLKESGLCRNGVYIDGFTGFTGLEMRVVERLMRLGDVTVCLPCDKPGSEKQAFATASQAAASLIQTAGKGNYEIIGEERLRELSECPAEKTVLKYISERLFEGQTEKYNGDTSSVELYTAGSPVEECELAAARCRGLLMDGCRLRDISVVAPEWENYENTAENIFGKYELPVYMNRRSDIMQKPVITFIVAAIDTVTGGWQYEDIFRCLKTGLWNISREELDILENYVITWDIKGSKWKSEADWDMNPDGFSGKISEEGEEILKTVNRLRRKIAAPLAELENRGSRIDRNIAGGESNSAGKEENDGDAYTERNPAKAVYEFAVNAGLPEQIAEKAGELEKKGDLQLRSEYLQLWDIIVSGLEQCVNILGNEPVGMKEFGGLYKLLLSQYTIGTIPATVDRIGMGSMDRMRRRGTKYLIIIGASEDSLPNAGGKTGIFSERDREIMAGLGIDLPDREDKILEREFCSIYHAISLPSEKLIMTCPMKSASGSVKRISYIVKRISLLTGNKIKIANADENRTFALKPCVELAAGRISTGNDGQEREENADDWADAACRAFAGRDELERLGKINENQPQRLSRETAEGLYGKKISLSASRMEKFNECPFKFFMSYGLNAKEREKAQFSAPEFGSFVHYILENVNREVNGDFRSTDNEECRGLARRYSEKYSEDELGGLKNCTERFIYLFNRLAGDTENVVIDMAEELRQSEFISEDYELKVGDNGKIKPGLGEDVSISGIIDRVDVWRDGDTAYLKVVDYKTGKKRFRLSDILYGLNMQMLLYLSILVKNGGGYYGEKIKAAGILYMPSKDITVSAKGYIDDRTAEKERRKDLKRSGLLLRSYEVAAAMEPEPGAKYLPVTIDKNGGISEKNTATQDEMEKLETFVIKKVKETAVEIREGNAQELPVYKTDGENACVYCDFKEACGFNQDVDEPRYTPDISEKEAWKQIWKETEQCQG